MKYIFICRIKILGFPFAVFDEDKAKAWVDQDPEMHVYDKVEIRDSV